MPALVLVALGTVATADACAYIDPGTGSLLYQTLLAMLLGAGILFRQTVLRVAGAATSMIRKVSGGGRKYDPTNTHS